MRDNLIVTPGPHISEARSTRSVMLDVIIALAPAMIAAVAFFRLQAVLLTATCIVACVVTEWLCNIIRKKPNSLGDLSAVVTGVILAFSVPPALPWWAAVIGSVFAIAIGKMVFGGLGANIFNPAMVGRGFLAVSFGVLMTTWTAPVYMPGVSPEWMAGVTEATTQSTPLAFVKDAIKDRGVMKEKGISAKDLDKQLKYMLLGSMGGCLGETSALLLLIGGVYLFVRRTIMWHIPVAMLAAVFIWAQIGQWVDATTYASPLVHLTNGGVMFCALFIATDPVTAPLTKKGMLIFGFGLGSITMLIRIAGGYPEGVMFAVLLMNAVTPLIDRSTKLVPAGGLRHD